MRGHVTRASTQHPAAMQGIVLSGGVAFNTKLHRALFEAFKVCWPAHHKSPCPLVLGMPEPTSHSVIARP